MNKNFLFAVLAMALSCNGLLAQEGKDTLRPYYYRLAFSKSAEDRVLVTRKMYDLLQSKQEVDWLMANEIFGVLGMKTTTDSLAIVAKERYPGGQFMQNLEVQTIYDAKTGADKVAAYKKWLKKYPVNKFESGKIIYDYAAYNVAKAFAAEKKVKKALYYAEQGQTPAWYGIAWSGTAAELEKVGYVDEAAVLYKKAIDNSIDFKTTRAKENGAEYAAAGYRSYCNSYARCLLLLKKPDSALVYAQKAYAEGKPVLYYNQTCVDALMALGRDKEAYEKADEIVTTGKADKKLKDIHKDLYAKVNAGGKSYEEYMKEVEAAVTKKIIANLKNTIINKPSPAFVLKDVNGNTVNSESLRGKVVVLDFWATWCGPCKRSFPAMQMAVNKYKDNPNVQFLFIHTWEREADATAAAKKYVDDNKYPFQVLMDLKDESGANKVVKSFEVSGIPAKFIIDKNGNIRFRITGFSGGDDAAVAELSAMIDMVM